MSSPNDFELPSSPSSPQGPPRARRVAIAEQLGDDDDVRDERDEIEDADPDRHIIDDEEEEGEDLMESMEKDYKAIPELDRYDARDIDEGDHEELDYAARRAVERQMRKRDAERAVRGARTPAALMALSGDEEEEEQRPRRRRRIADLDGGEPGDGGDGGPPDDDDDPDDNFVDLEDYKGPLKEWLSMDAPRREIRRRFRLFLTDFRVENQSTPVYASVITKMCADNRQSLEVSYRHLSTAVPALAVWLADEPDMMLPLLDEEAMAVVLTMFPRYHQVHRDVHVRLTHVPIVDKLRDLRQIHLHALIKVEGVVTRRTSVFPQLKLVKYNCVKCRTLMGPFVQNSGGEVAPGRCPECQSKGPFSINSSETVYQNYQKITLQEAPGTVAAGRVPRQKDVILLHDLIDSVSPGEEVEITGVYKHTYDTSLNWQNGFPVFNTVIEANYVSTRADVLDSLKPTDDDIREIIQLSKKPDVAQQIIDSIAPSIFGHSNIKTMVALSLFGGEPKLFPNKHRIRGDINLLVLGDPGTAKSQFLKYIEKTAHRAVYTTGKGASAVGLTASVHADPVTREWTLEGGALVLADQGVCLIDEFDKMNDQDRTSIHEAMEQQSISISKAGIITTLKARCAVIAAANPVLGRYDSSATFAENVQLSDAILSRFDCLAVVKDEVDRDNDRRLASFVVDSHMRSHPTFGEEESEVEENKEQSPIPQALLRKYIMYARKHCHPKLNNIDEDKIAKLYSELRRESLNTGGIPIAVRHIESMVRMSEAHAKMHLRDYVAEEDVNMAIRVMLESFISTQKFAVKRSLEKHFRKYMTFKRDSFELLNFILYQLVKESLSVRQLKSAPRRSDHGEDEEGKVNPLLQEPVEVEMEDFQQKAAELSITNLQPFYESNVFRNNGYSISGRKIIKTFN